MYWLYTSLPYYIYITNCTSVFVESVMIASIHLAEQVLFVHYYGHTVYKTISNVYIYIPKQKN